MFREEHMVRKSLDYHNLTKSISELPEFDSDAILINSNGSIGINPDLGKSPLAKSMSAPIRRSLPYHGIARRALNSTITYDKDIDVSAVLKFEHDEIVIDSNGNIGKVPRRRFNVIDRAVQKARQEIMSQEDDAIFAALDAATGFKNPILESKEDKIFGQRVIVPEFEIYANPTVRIGEVKRRRFNIIDRDRELTHMPCSIWPQEE